MSFETDIKVYLKQRRYEFIDNTAKKAAPDFSIYISQRWFRLEVKEKLQAVRIDRWPAVDFPEVDLFILDELSARRLLMGGALGGLAVRDYQQPGYIFFDVLRLWTMPRKRVLRQFSLGRQKAKWLINLRNGIYCKDLNQLIDTIRFYLLDMDFIYNDDILPYGPFYGEVIETGGTPRTAEQRQHDRAVTR